MKEIGTEKFDELLKSKIVHFSNYPEMLPFIGSHWVQSKRILLIGESHYFPFFEVHESYFIKWYDLNSKDLTEGQKSYITTRKNFVKIKSGGHSKPLLLYYNLQKAVREAVNFKDEQFVFNEFCFYNYFQKPASANEIKGENRSIDPTKEDKEFAFKTFEKFVDIVKPKNVIFVSKKSYDAFNEVKSQGKAIFSNIKIDFVPHAGRQWWNRKSKAYGNRTGKQKFIDILENCYK